MKMIKAFLSTKAIKDNGKTACYLVVRNYFNTILHGLREAKELLLLSFCNEIEISLMSFKKRVVSAKLSGDVGKNEANSILFSLYNYLCI